MPHGTPFHSRTAALCISQNWRSWSGYFVASSYDVMHDYEYHAIRSSAALIDVSPLFKYDVRGSEALRLVNRVITRDAANCRVGQALYTCLCDEAGKVIQDGTVFRLEENHFRFHLADPSLRWLRLNAVGMDVAIEDASEAIAALALQGPNAFAILREIVAFDLSRLGFFKLARSEVAGIPAIVSRTGYTGDLGYELWCQSEHAESLWDRLIERGRPFGIKPAGMLALDLARLEAGFILIEVDYIGVENALIASQKYSPFEIGLAWTVDFKKNHFIGHQALRGENERGAGRQIIGLEVDLQSYERLFQAAGLPPQFPATAWRGTVPVYKEEIQVGHATTGGWSPMLKKYLVLATVAKEHALPGQRLEMEVTVDHKRKTSGVTVVKLPFLDPPRKKASMISSTEPGLDRGKR